MKKLLITGLIIVITVFVLFGCSDDTDCPTCPQFTQTGLAMFESYIYDNTLRCYGVMYGIDGRFVDVDSVMVDTLKMGLDQYFGEGMATYCSLEDDMLKGSKSIGGSFLSAFATGDTIEIKIYSPNGISKGSVTVLDRDLDKPIIYDWTTDYPYDTVALNTELTIAWAPVQNTDFYAVDYRYNHNNNGVYQTIDTTYTVNDTTFVIPSSLLDYDGRVYIDVYAINGPNFTDVGNISGGSIVGRVNSIVSEYFRIYIGTGDPYPDTYTGTKQEEEIIPKTIEDFIQ